MAPCPGLHINIGAIRRHRQIALPVHMQSKGIIRTDTVGREPNQINLFTGISRPVIICRKKMTVNKTDIGNIIVIGIFIRIDNLIIFTADKKKDRDKE